MTAPSVENIFPSDTQTGVVLGSTIWVLFDREIDITTVTGAFIVEGPDTDKWTGPDMVLLDRPDTEATENMLDSPNFKGIVQGTFTTEYIDSGGQVSEGPDYSGQGSGDTVYKHRVIFTPDTALSPNTEYTIYLLGDENTADSIIFGIATRTVFDAQSGLNSGEGELVPYGGYTDTTDDVFHFTITGSGGYGVATYEWYRESDPLIVRTGTVSAARKALIGGDGLEVSWSVESGEIFAANDTFTVQCRAPIYMESSYQWTFTTGSGSITALPVTTSTSPIGGLGVDAVADLEVLSVNPDVRETNVSLDTHVITITFNKNLDSDALNDRMVKIEALSVNGDPSIASSGELKKILRVNGQVLYAILQSSEDAV